MGPSRTPFDLVALACLVATVWAAQDGPVTARTTFTVSGATVVAVCQLHQWFTQWSRRLGEPLPAWAGWVWSASLVGLATSAAATSWWTATMHPSSAHADGLHLAASACVVVAAWTLAPWTGTPAGTALSLLFSDPRAAGQLRPSSHEVVHQSRGSVDLSSPERRRHRPRPRPRRQR